MCVAVLGVVAAVSCAVIGAISGSGLTGIAAIGPLLIPEMEKRGYPREYATALIANSSILGLLIPPLVTMIVYGWVTDTSILACFLPRLARAADHDVVLRDQPDHVAQVRPDP